MAKKATKKTATKKAAPAAQKPVKKGLKKSVKPTAKKTAPPKPKKAEIKTKPTDASIEAFIDQLPDEQKRRDAYVVLDMMKKATKIKPKLWGNSIIGFGERVYTSPATGRQVDWLTMGFSPRKANLSLYLHGGHAPYSDQLKKLGKYKTGAGCLYINKLSDVDVKVLDAIVKKSAEDGKKGS